MMLTKRALAVISDCPRTAHEVGLALGITTHSASNALTNLVRYGRARISATPSLEIDVNGCQHSKHVYEVVEPKAKAAGK